MSNRDGNGCLPQIIGMVLLFAILGIVSMCQESQSRLIKNAREHNKMGNYEHYLEKYPTGRYAGEAYDAVVRLWDEMDFYDFQDIPISVSNEGFYKTFHKSALNNYERLDSVYTNADFLAKLHDKMEAKCRVQYDIAMQLNTLDGWAHYLIHAPERFLFDAQEKYDELYNKVWGTEKDAWDYATERNTIADYEEYELLYPNGKHVKEAEKRAVDLRVSDIYGREHGSLPTMNKTSYGSGASSTVWVENSTSYVLTVYYSGTDGKRLTISPYGRQAITLTNGQYRIAASVDNSSVRPFAGSETLTGGEYNVKYYIMTSRY